MEELQRGTADLQVADEMLAAHPFYRLRFYEELPSTNLQMRQFAEEAEGLVIVADRQSGGIGRMGRRFESPGGSGLYFSVLLKPDGKRVDPMMITAMAAVAVCRGMEAVMPCDVRIKWVNDIYQDHKKICGILAQGAVQDGGTLAYTILGIGVNVYEPQGGFSEEIQNIAGAWANKPQENLRGRLLASILQELFALYTQTDERRMVEEYRNRSFLIGRRVLVCVGEEQREATVLDIDGACNLCVRFADGGGVQTLMAGEVRLRV